MSSTQPGRLIRCLPHPPPALRRGSICFHGYLPHSVQPERVVLRAAGRGPLSPKPGAQPKPDGKRTRSAANARCTLSQATATLHTHLTRTSHVTYPTLYTHPTYTQNTPHTRRRTPYVLSTLHAPRTKHHLTPHPSHIRINTRTTYTRARAHTHTHTHTHTHIPHSLGTRTSEDTRSEQAPPTPAVHTYSPRPGSTLARARAASWCAPPLCDRWAAGSLTLPAVRP